MPGTHHVPLDKLPAALREAPLPVNDFNTRIVLFGRDAAQARALADAMGRTPYQNVSTERKGRRLQWKRAGAPAPLSANFER